MFRRKIKDIQEHAKNRGISLERRLFLYWLIMVLAVMAAVFVVLIVAGVFSNDARKLGGTLSVQQKNTTMTFNKLIDTLNAQNLALSEQITREVSDILETEERTFKDLDNNPELITEPDSVPLTENSPVKRANCPYGQTKVDIEYMSEELQKAVPEFSVTLLRYFNPVGAHESGLIGEDPRGIPFQRQFGKTPVYCSTFRLSEKPRRQGAMDHR